MSYILAGMLHPKHPKGTKRRSRNPERTRVCLLHAAFREVLKSGFESASLDTILAATGVTKGALYHHFGSKKALGYAIVEQVIAVSTRDKWLRPLQSGVDPIDTLIRTVQGTSLRPAVVRTGCPLNNLAQEMSQRDERFRKYLAKVFYDWQEGMATALRRGQSEGTVRRDLDAREAASFLIATYEGYVTLAKNAEDAKLLKVGIRNIVGWLESIRMPKKGTGRGKA
jgi:TetR/AcrR family transcriptional regulator, transcriptional repressor for nem operon